jgi:thioredoxin type arsenate reductase
VKGHLVLTYNLFCYIVSIYIETNAIDGLKMRDAPLVAQPPSILKLLAQEVRWQILSTLIHSDYRVQELVNLIAHPANLISYHLKQLRQQQLVTERRSSPDARDVYYSVDLERLRAQYLAAADALHPALAIAEAAPEEAASNDPPVRVLFLCTHNSARSQMAEGLLRELGKGEFEVASAGTVATRVRPEAIAAMRELEIDITGQSSKTLQQFLGDQWDEVITVCDSANESCPVFPGAKHRLHWSIDDPSGVTGSDEERLAAFRRARDELKQRIEQEIL